MIRADFDGDALTITDICWSYYVPSDAMSFLVSKGSECYQGTVSEPRIGGWMNEAPQFSGQT